MPLTDINGFEVYYELHEGMNRETIILLHHGFGCTKMWKEIYPDLVEKGFRVLMYDRRGYGASEGGDDFRSFYISDQFRNAAFEELTRLADLLNLDSFHIVGQCEGGVVGADFAARRPEKVKSLTTSSTLCFSEITMADFNRLKFPKSFQELESDMRDKLLDWHGKDYAEDFFEMFRTYGGAYGKDFFDLRPVLADVQCPSLVIYPDRSFLFEVEQGLHFYRSLPKGELAVIPRCGHNTYEQNPGEYTRLLLDFLKRLGA